jgi:predicted nucleic acid-binding protein
MRVVVDTNVAFSALAAGCGDLALRLLSPTETNFYAPRFLFIELFKNKARLVDATKLPEEKLLQALHELIESLQLIEAASIPVGVWMQARRLCDGVDLKDTPFVALTLHLDARLWTDDEELKTGLRAKGFDQFFEP